MGADQNFEAFRREERIWPMGDFLDDGDREYMVERRAIELTHLAKEKGLKPCTGMVA